MSQPPITNRQYAYFCVIGPATHEHITETIGLSPSEAYNPGDERPPRGVKSKHMYWKLDSGHDDTEPLEEHIRTILTFLNTRVEAIRQLWDDYDLILECVGFFPPSGHGFHLDRETIRQAARLGIAVDLDFYYTEEPDLPKPKDGG